MNVEISGILKDSRPTLEKFPRFQVEFMEILIYQIWENSGLKFVLILNKEEKI